MKPIKLMSCPKLILILALQLATCLSHAQNVGIGTAAPAEKLHVAGNLRADFLAGTDTRLVAADANGSLLAIPSGGAGDMLTLTLAGPTWASPSAAATAWNLTGNAGTTPASNFIGTTDVQALAFGTNGTERARITATGLVCINGTGPIASDRFSVYAAGAEYAVNGYASGSGNAGYFQAMGSSAALVSWNYGTHGSAAQFVSASAAPTPNPTVYVYNGSSVAPSLSLRTDVSNNNAHGILIDVNGTGINRGIQIDMDAANAGNGVSVLQYGAGHGVTVQSFNTANNLPGVYSDQAGTGRSFEGKTLLPSNTVQTAYFGQASNGLTPATYANATAVWGQSAGIRGGAFLSAGGSTSNTVFQALYNGGAGNFDGVGVYGGFAPNPNYGYGVVGQGNWYGVFANGNLGASGVKSFLIDHPMDPENKFLRHFSIESPEVLNLYRGNVELDANGEAVVTLPSYFSAINSDLSYQLTAVGAPAAVYVAEEVNAAGEFKIAGGNPGQKICWTLYADRSDPFVQQHPTQMEVEPLKRPHQQGRYLLPELYNQPKEKGMFEGNLVHPEALSNTPAPISAPTQNEIPTPKATR